jgi:hypothetical protein
MRGQETLLAVLGQIEDSLYSNTWEAVHTLKRPFRGIDSGAIRSLRCISPS